MSEIKQFHLINETGELQPGLQDHLKEYNPLGKDYTIISIIGSQSSGKSTLLNRLFNTNFEVMASQIERRQVTKGIWLANGIKNNNSNIIVLDVEGSDSRERWDERQVYEQSTALFALALSQVLIINLWTHEVGRFSGSQYGILKVIFEMNIKLFGQDQMKQLVFILRDYSDMENFMEICELIEGDIAKIWEEIAKPEEFKTKKPEQLFKIDFFYLSHMLYAIKEFNQGSILIIYKFIKQKGIDDLKQIFFNKDNQRYLLRDFDFQTNILINDVPLYAEQIWQTIKSNKDLNLPSEKIVIANMRCNQIQQESKELIQQELKLFHKTNAKKQIYHQFGNDGQIIFQKCLKYYDENTIYYSKEVKQEKRNELEQQILQKFYIEYEIQKKNIHQYLLTQYIKSVELIQLDSGNMNDLMGLLNEAREKQIQQYQSAIYKSQIKENTWEIEPFVQEFKDIIQQQQAIFIEKFLNFFLIKKEKEMRKDIQKVQQIKINNIFLFQIINACLFEFDLNFWNNLKTQCIKILQSNETEIERILQKSFKLEINECQEKLQNFKQDFNQTIESELKRKCLDLQFYALKKFKNEFGRKENGAPINWRIVSLEEIEPKYKEATKITLNIFQQFQYYQLNLNEIPTKEMNRLIEEEDYKKLLTQINQDMEQEYKDALDTHNSKAGSPIPKWMWALLIFFMYDEVFMFLTSSWCLIPTLLTVVFIGQKSLPLSIVKQIWRFINEKFGPQLYKLGNLLGII